MRAENNDLRQQLAAARSDAKRLHEKIDSATARLEGLLSASARLKCPTARTPSRCSLLGRTYRVACEDDERESLMQAVAYLDSKMNEIRKAGKVMGAERIAVMAALNVAHELLSVRLGAGFDVGTGETAHLPRSSRRLDAAIAKQEKLF